MNLEDTDDAVRQQRGIWRELKVRLFYVYIGIAIFLISFMISEFYEVFLDILLPLTQGSTGESRTIIGVIFQSPFSGGWVGNMPWYGQFPVPSDLGTYHECWSWIFFTTAFTDNPTFLEQIITTLMAFSIIVGLVFLTPLAVKTIRQSFVPSMFFFMTGVAIFTKATFGCFAQAFALAFGTTRIQYGAVLVTGDMIPNLFQAFLIGIPILLVIFAFFVLLGKKLYSMHYTDSKLRSWFIRYIAFGYWIGFVLSIIVV